MRLAFASLRAHHCAMKHVTLALMLAFPLPGLAEGTMSASEFEAFTTGKTFTYAEGNGTPYGAERYLPGRRVEWSYLDGDCQSGEWFEELGLICFVYEGDYSDPQCWSFSNDDGRLKAQFENIEGGTTLYSIEQSDDPLLCLGPKVGV